MRTLLNLTVASLALLASVSAAAAVDFRLQGGFGYGMGSNGGTIGSGAFNTTVQGANISVNGSASGSGLGGDGIMGEFSGWADWAPNWLGRGNLSVGLQYLHFGNTSSGSFSGTVAGNTTITTTVSGTGVIQGVVVSGSTQVTVPFSVTGTGSGSGGVDVSLNAAMANFAWRLNDTGILHPYVGIGLGAVFADVTGRANVNVTIGGTPFNIAGQAHISRTAAATQFFLGTDVDLSGGWYVGGQANVLFAGSDISVGGLAGSVDLNTRQISVSLHTGYRF